jgi:hypothetical protein
LLTGEQRPPPEAAKGRARQESRIPELRRAPKPRLEGLASAWSRRGYVLGQLSRKPNGRTLILHLLNYDHQAPAENVKIRLELSGLVQDVSRWEVKVLSSDAGTPQFDSLSLHGSVCKFTLGRIDHYTVVTLSARPGP